MWDMRRNVKSDVFPPGRTVVELYFTDVPQTKRHWWLVSDHHNVDLCLNDAGYEANLYVTADLHSMARVCMGDAVLDHAMRTGQVKVHGPTVLRWKFRAWLGLSSFAGVRDQRARAGV